MQDAAADLFHPVSFVICSTVTPFSPNDEGGHLRLLAAFRATLRAAGLRLAVARGFFPAMWA